MNEQKRRAESTAAALPAEEAEVRDLLRAAGPRPAPPAGDLAAIKAATRAEWRRTVAERGSRPGWRYRSALPLAAGLMLALVAGWWWIARPAPPVSDPVARIERSAPSLGAVVTLPRETPLAPAAGSALPAGTLLETPPATAGSPAWLTLRLGGGQSLRLDGDTRVRLASSRRLELERGAVYLDSGGTAGADGSVAVATPFGVVRDIGTQFEVRLGSGAEALRVRVREGEVVVDAGGESHSAAEGEELSMAGDGSARRAAVPRHGGEWEWVVAAAPSLEIEGLTLRSFLDWASRETGLWLRFEDTALEQSAAAIRLHGTIADLTPRQALDVVLPGSGLTHRVEEGTLLVLRRAAGS